jgi:periplasmic copper chaperone A
MVRVGVVLAAAAITVVGLPGLASAHVTVQPEAVEGGGFTVVAFRVPNEREDANSTKLTVLLPADHPLAEVQTTPMPGWTISTKERTLDKPIDFFGSKVSRVVSQVTWATTGAGIRPEQFEDFEVSLGQLPESGEMVFRALQTYSDGEQVNWNEVSVDSSVEPEHPAPVLTLTAPSPAGESSDSPPASSPTSADTPTAGVVDSPVPDDAEADSDTDSVVPLVLSGAALLVSLAALALVGRRTRA